MRILIGCPVLHREWCMPAWFDHVLEARVATRERLGDDFDFGYVFVGDKERDPKTYDVIMRQTSGTVVWRDVVDPKPTDDRKWNQPRYKRMAELRNELLDEVRKDGPDAFLSLDSDILLHRDAISVLLEELEPDRAVGGKVYLSEHGTRIPSWAKIGRDGQLQRNDSVGTFKVDVIMAMKLMSPKAYNVDYAPNVQGEDTGWSKLARAAGVKLVWVGSVASKHLFTREALHEFDPRVGF